MSDRNRDDSGTNEPLLHVVLGYFCSVTCCIVVVVVRLILLMMILLSSHQSNTFFGDVGDVGAAV